MKIGFFHIDTRTEASELGYLCARALVKSAKRTMPDVPIVHLTDQTSPTVKGVDDVRRKPSEPMALLRMRHHAGLDGDWLFVDTDVIFQMTVKRAFRVPFDIGITSRNWAHLKAATGFTDRMPFNTGVVFSRCPEFWREVYTRLRQADPAKQHWMGDQEVIGEIVAEQADRRDYLIRTFKGATYNFPPVVPGAAPDEAAMLQAARIVHYKGAARKPMLLARVKGVTRCA